MKTRGPTRRILAWLLTLSMCLSLLPGVALAEGETTYTQVASIEDVTCGGDFVLVAENEGTYYALGSAIENKITAVEVTVSDGAVAADSLPVWTLAPSDDGVTLSNGTNYLAYNSSTNFKSSTDAYEWDVAVNDSGAFRFTASGSATRAIAYGISQAKFGAYSTTNSSGYVFDLLVFKAGSASSGGTTDPTPDPDPGKTQYAKLDNDIQNGDQLIVYYNKDSLVMGSAVSGKGLAGVAATPNGDFIEVAEGMAVLTAEAEDDGSFSFTNAEGKYLTSGATGNALTFETDANEYSTWTVSAVTGGIHLVSVNAQYSGSKQALEIYNGVFTTFTEKATDYYLFNLYTLTDEKPETEPPDPEEPEPSEPASNYKPANGDTVAIYYPGGGLVLTGTASGSRLTGSAATVEGTALLTDGSELLLNVTVDANGYYTFTSGGKYLTTGATGSSLTLTDAASDYSLWQLEETDGGWYIKNVNATYSGNAQYIEYYNGFTTYKLGSGGAIYTMQFFKNIKTANVVDSSVVESIAAWGGGGPYADNAASVNGDKYTVGDMRDTNAVFTAVVSGSPVKPFTSTSTTTGATNYYMGGTGLGSGTDDYLQFAVSTAGWGDMTLSFRLRASNTGSGEFQLQYSTDGTSFVNFTTGEYAYSYTQYSSDGSSTPVSKDGAITDGVAKTSLNPGGYIAFTFDVPTGAENAAKLYIRLVPGYTRAKGEGTPGTGGTVRVDSVVLSGSPIVDDSITGYVTVTPDGVEEDQAPGTELTMTSATAGAAIMYRFDGGGWLTYDESSKPVLPDQLPTNLEVYATSAGKANSVTRIFTYAAGTVEAVKMIPNGGGVYIEGESTTVTLSCKTDGATIFYRTDANAKFAEYTAPIVLNKGFGSLTIEAYAVKEGFKDSSVVKRDFTEMASDKYSIYFGQLHSHTNISDGAGSITDAYEHASGVDNLDFLAVTDHSNSFDGTSDTLNTDAAATSPEWAAAKAAAAAITTEDFVGIYGFEMTWSNGLGHINTYNTAGWQSRTQTNYTTYSTALQNYYAELKTAPESLSQFNHPGTTFGDFSDFAYYDEEIDQLITMIEVGNGEGAIGSSGYFPSYEYYTRALDKGWHVAPSNNQDNHKGYWGDANTGRTVVLATSLTEEAIYDAVRNYRVYATEDNDLNIYYTLDGNIMGSMLTKSDVGDNVTLEIQLADLTDSAIGKVEVIVNGGLSIANQEVTSNSGTVTFTVPSTYNYYYIKVTQTDGDIAVTAPVWIGEVEAVGISSLTAGSDLTMVGEEQTFTLELYNNEKKNLEISSIVFTDKATGKVLYTDSSITFVPKLGTASCTFPYTFTTDGIVTITATVTGMLNGAAKRYTQDLELTVMPAEIVGKIIVDGTHFNDYITGYYGGNMSNMTSIAADSGVKVEIVTKEITADMLKDCSLLVISAPARKSGTANAGDYTASTFEDSFIELVADYVKAGGNVIVCGLADYQDKSAVYGTEGHAAAQINKLLAAIGSTMSINDDEVCDPVNNGGQFYRLYPSVFNTDSPWTAGIVDGQTYSQYSGCSVNVGDGTWLVRGFDTTYSVDSDKDGVGNTGEVETDDSYGYNIVTPRGEVVFLACEETAYGGTIFAAGGVFLSDFEVKAELDNIWDLPYANRTIYENIMGTLCATDKVTPIAATRTAELNKIFVIEGYVTNGTANPNTTFFDAIYVQDETGGTTVFPYSTEGLAIGTKVRIIGYTDAYQDDREIQVLSLKVLGEEPCVYNPRELTTQQASDYDNYGGQLVSTTGTVSDIIQSNGIVSQFKLTDSTGVAATVFIDGYITNPDGVNSIGTWIKNGQTVTAAGLLYMHPEGSSDVSVPVLRVRNCDEIVLVSAGNTPVQPGNPGSGSAVYVITVKPTSNGTVTVSPMSAGKGAAVTITVTPDAGYELSSLMATDQNGNALKLTDMGNGKYTFTMPASKVSVAANFIRSGAPGTGLPFLDVPAGAWYESAVEYVYEKDLMHGVTTTTFGPELTTTRGMIVTILYRLESEPAVGQAGFTDVAAGEYYTNAVAWAAANGIVNGYGDGTFAPEKSITREEMAAILYRYASFKGYDVSARADLSGFTDSATVSSYAVEAMQWANAEGLITGVTTSTLVPQGSASRVQAAMILMRFCENVAK